jgi:hypothetical protein
MQVPVYVPQWFWDSVIVEDASPAATAFRVELRAKFPGWDFEVRRQPCPQRHFVDVIHDNETHSHRFARCSLELMAESAP